MYADFYELFHRVFGIDIPFLSLVKTFGFLVAMAFLAAGYVLYLELKRKEQLGIVFPIIKEVKVKTKQNPLDWILHAVVAFLLGYKLLGMFFYLEIASPDPLSFLFSSVGHLGAGIGVCILALALKYYEYKKQQNKNNEIKSDATATKMVKYYPRMLVGDMAVIAAVAGFSGAKIFNALETWDNFLADPLGSLLSSSGLTFYGGLIVATIALWIYARKIKLDFRHLCDAAAPALILAYGIGRLGCQVSGDGDWGIFNSAYTTNIQYKVEETKQTFTDVIAQNQMFIRSHFNTADEVQHIAFTAPSFIPTWLVAYNYPHNVNNVGIQMNNCEGKYCSVLPMPVYPTPLYEFVISIFIFLILWRLRKNINTPLVLFSIYLIFNGLERFFIEKIRVNSTYHIGTYKATQAEIIALCIIASGLVILLMRNVINKWAKG